jgi:hypothetical protein
VKYLLLNTLFCFSLLYLSAQVPSAAPEAFPSGITTESSTVIATVTGQYRDLSLGMTMEEVKEILKKDNYFDYRGEVDVTMFNNPNENIIDCRGSGFIERAWFQFRDEKLFIMELELDRQKIDYYTVYGQLEKKYGSPSGMTPQFATWSGEEVDISLEYPLTIKYLDRIVFDAFLDESQVNETFREKSRQSFVEEF